MSAVHPEMPSARVADPEILAINREFLALVTDPALPDGQPVCGLDADVVTRLRSFAPEQLDAVATTPVLLADFAVLPGRDVAEAAEHYRVTNSATPATWCARMRDFAYCLLTSVWQLSRQPTIAAPVRLGLEEPCLRALARLDFSDLLGRAGNVCTTLRAVHADNPHCWSALIAAVGSGDRRRIDAARLSFIPLTVAVRRADH